MRRGYVLLSIALGVALFLVISAILARVFSADDAERAAITTLVRAEARGDAGAMIAQLYRCGASEACRARVAADAGSLERPGSLAILELNTSTSFSLASTLGTARVAWRAGSALPVTQCVRVRRAGNAITGLRIELLEISLRIPSDSSCPPTY